MEFNLLIWILSILPIVLLLFLMAKVKMSSKNAAILSLILTAFIALFFYEINISQLFIAVQKGAALSLYVSLYNFLCYN